MPYDQQSLKLHKKYGGKLEIRPKVPLNKIDDLCLAYTPGVAAVCQKIARDSALAKIYTIKKNTVAVITDGSAVLGLGNLGSLAALPVMEGKCALFKSLAGVDAFPICLDTQDTEEIIKTIKNIAPIFGGINLEDISAPRCFEIERRLKAKLDIPIFHDDQHGTAVIVLAALINALKIRKTSKSAAKIVISGAGAAGTAIVKLLLAEGYIDILVCDSKGIISKTDKSLTAEKQELANLTNPQKLKGDLAKAMAGRDVFIGVSAGNIVNEKMVKTMNSRPIIFALSNPKPEIDPRLAKKAGAYIVATGRSDFENQINNVLAFPGIFRGALDNNVKNITPAMLVRAAENLAACVKHPTPRRVLPSVFSKSIVKAVANAINNN